MTSSSSLRKLAAWASLLSPLAATSVVADATPEAFEQSCAGLRQTARYGGESATVLLAEVVEAGTNITTADTDPTCAPLWKVVSADVCRLQLNVSTSARSSFIMEAWMPRDWETRNRRFAATGNGGIGGCIGYDDMDYAASLGFAATGSDNGHSGQSGARFFHNPDAVLDFTHRALHQSALLGKRIAAAFYSSGGGGDGDDSDDDDQRQQPGPDTSYYIGCSTGGRQGLQMAQMFPGTFDGILAGDPAIAFNNLTSWSGSFVSKILRARAAGGDIPSALYAAIDDALLAQCDGLDGALDRIVEDPRLCDFKPEAMLCGSGSGGGDQTGCLTQAQVSTVRSLLSPLYGVGGALVYPRIQPAPTIVGSLLQSYGASDTFLYTDEWFKYAVYGDPSLNTTFLGPEDWARAWAQDPGQGNAWSGDLAGSRDAGTKVLHYHGLEDSIISSDISNAYYDHVSKTMGLPSSSAADTAEGGSLDDFYRLFRISGMNHCQGGTGASGIGFRNGDTTPATFFAQVDGDSEAAGDSIFAALVRWVERGHAPEKVTGLRYVDGDEGAGVVDYRRDHCRYPFRNAFDGSDPKDPAGWQCVL